MISLHFEVFSAINIHF